MSVCEGGSGRGCWRVRVRVLKAGDSGAICARGKVPEVPADVLRGEGTAEGRWSQGRVQATWGRPDSAFRGGQGRCTCWEKTGLSEGWLVAPAGWLHWSERCPYTTRLWGHFPVRAHTQVTGSIPRA